MTKEPEGLGSYYRSVWLSRVLWKRFVFLHGPSLVERREWEPHYDFYLYR